VSLVSDPRGLEDRVAGLDLTAHTQAEYHFLIDRYVDAATLAKATAIAGRWGVRPHDVLIATGRLKADDYYRALAVSCGASFTPALSAADIVPPAASLSPRQHLAQGLLKDRTTNHYIFAPDRLSPNTLRHILGQLYPHRFALASPHAVRRAIYRHFARAFAHDAIDGLAERYPERSARMSIAPWQRLSSLLGAIGILVSFLVAPIGTLWFLTLLLSILFVPVIVLRLVALQSLLHADSSRNRPTIPREADSELPIYTVLVPLYREAHMLRGLVQSLLQLDWPASKLDIKLILEESDKETVEVAEALALPGNIEIVLVPELHPRTKPKALNYALPLTRGEYLVIFDAEDRPERDQLRQAFHVFRTGPPDLAVVQAQLNLYNAKDNWLAKQFTLEYCVLFDGLLPAFDRLALPIPLGGSSNHFRVSALTWLMAWDPFNVTEDADLGIRLARSSYRCRVLQSTTYEEAPRKFRHWLNQRTRWLKGYVQTWLVHMRSPRALWRELGPRGFLAFQVMVGGTVLSALVHPWFYALAAFELLSGGVLVRPESLLGWPFWLIASFTLITGYLAPMALGYVTARRRGHRHLLKQIPLMPLYWLLISFAAYRAMWRFMTARFTWEKTEHGFARKVVIPAR